MNSCRGSSKIVTEKYTKMSKLRWKWKYFLKSHFAYWLVLYELYNFLFSRTCLVFVYFRDCFWCGVCQKEKYVGSGERLQLSSVESNIFSLLPLHQVSAKNYTPVACLTAGHLGCYYCLLLSDSCIMYFIRHSTYMYIFSLGLFLFSTSIFQNVTENYLATHTIENRPIKAIV